jgi:hypothetical protein
MTEAKAGGQAAAFTFNSLLIRCVRSSSPPGESNMPSTVNLYLIGVWFCVGFFTGAGWAIAAWLVGRIFSHM